MFDGGVGADKAGDVEGLKAQSGAQAPDVAETGLIFFGEDGELLTDEDVTPSSFESASGEESKEVHDRDDLAHRLVNPSSSSRQSSPWRCGTRPRRRTTPSTASDGTLSWFAITSISFY